MKRKAAEGKREVPAAKDVKRKAAEGKREGPMGPRRQKKAEMVVVEMRVVGVEKKERRHRLTCFGDDEADAIIKKAKADTVNGAVTEAVTVNEAVTEAVTVNEASPKPSTSRHRSPFRKYGTRNLFTNLRNHITRGADIYLDG